MSHALVGHTDRVRQLFDHLDAAVWTATPDWSEIHYVSTGFAKLWQRDPAHLYADPKNFFDTLHPDDRAAAIAAEPPGDGPGPWIREYRIVRPDGSVRWIEDRTYGLRDGDSLVELIGIAEDITPRKRVEERLRMQSHMLDAVGQAVIATDLEGRISYWNRAAERMYGWHAEEVIGRPIVDVTPSGLSRAEAEQILASLVAGGSWSGELEVKRKDGCTFSAHVTDGPVCDAAGQLVAVVGVSSDVTERRELEAQLRQAQKMEAIGRLAGGIAHDFNNLLTAILSHAELALAASTEERVRDDVTVVRDTAHRAAALTRQLLAFSRRQVVQPQPVDLNTLLRRTEEMLGRLLGEQIRVAAMPDPHPRFAWVDPGQLEQVLLNLVVNAKDAMPSGGTLTLRAGHTVVDERFALEFGVAAGPYVTLGVADTGVGMTPEIRARIFEPFFTTKEVGKGTGLGLSTVYGIARQAGGCVAVESEPGVGSRFTVFLPWYQGPAPTAAAVAGGSLPSGSERVLVVEDEPLVRCSIRRILERHGYEVLEAADGTDALRQLDRGAVVDLVITDLVMPEMGGRELLAILRERGLPAQRLVMSGYDENVGLGGDPIGDGAGYLEKPFTVEALLGAVREALEAARAAARR